MDSARPVRNTTILILGIAALAVIGFLVGFYLYLNYLRETKASATPGVQVKSLPEPASSPATQISPPVFGWINPTVQERALGQGAKASIGPLVAHEKTVHFKLSSSATVSFGVTNTDWKDTILGDDPNDWISGASLDHHSTSCFYADVLMREVTCKSSFAMPTPYLVVQDSRIPGGLTGNRFDGETTIVHVTTYQWGCVSNCPR